MAIDIHDILNNYDAQNKPVEEPRKTIAESLVTQMDAGDKSIQSATKSDLRAAAEKGNLDDEDAKRLKMAESISSKGYEFNGRQLDAGEYQRFLRASFTNTLEIKNAQKVVMIANRENMRKGLGLEVGREALMKAAGKSQVSTIAIPTQLLRYVQQEIGGLNIKVTQNDIMTGFLYWYFGKPDDVVLGSEDAVTKIFEIASNLDTNASPAKFNKVSYNTSNTVLDRLDDLIGKIDQILSLAAGLTKDSLESKVKSDKLYIALCYNILNMLAFTPPIMPGEQPQDVDILAGGMVWDLMLGVDSAYDYYKARNGREIYRSKMRSRTSQFSYAAPKPAVPSVSSTAS